MRAEDKLYPSRVLPFNMNNFFSMNSVKNKARITSHPPPTTTYPLSQNEKQDQNMTNIHPIKTKSGVLKSRQQAKLWIGTEESDKEDYVE